jgi:hypothetical protein
MLTTDAFVALMAILAASPVLATAPHKEPHHEHEKHVAKRSPGVYICTGSNWTGYCYWEEAAVGYCYNDWLGPNTSFGPDRGLSCIVHPESDCKGDNFLTQYPGNTKLYFTGLSWICKNA